MQEKGYQTMSKKKMKGQEKETRLLPSKSRHILLREEEKVDSVGDDDDSRMKSQ